MVKGGKTCWRKVNKVDAKILQVEQITQRPLGAAPHQGREGLGVVTGADSLRSIASIDRAWLSGAGHGVSLKINRQIQRGQCIRLGNLHCLKVPSNLQHSRLGLCCSET